MKFRDVVNKSEELVRGHRKEPKALFDKCFTGGDLDLRGTTCYQCSFGGGMELRVDSNTRLISCHLEDCEFVLPDGVDEVTVYAHSSRFVNNKVRDGKKVKLEHATRS